MVKTTFIIGKRNTGKSKTICQKINNTRDTLIVIETDKDYVYHQTHSPNAILIQREEGMDKIEIPENITTVALDNVIFYPNDPLFWQCYHCSSIQQLIVAISHPIPFQLSKLVYEEVISLSSYIACMEKRLNDYIKYQTSSQSISSLSSCSNVSL